MSKSVSRPFTSLISSLCSFILWSISFFWSSSWSCTCFWKFWNFLSYSCSYYDSESLLLTMFDMIRLSFLLLNSALEEEKSGLSLSLLIKLFWLTYSVKEVPGMNLRLFRATSNTFFDSFIIFALYSYEFCLSNFYFYDFLSSKSSTSISGMDSDCSLSV